MYVGTCCHRPRDEDRVGKRCEYRKSSCLISYLDTNFNYIISELQGDVYRKMTCMSVR